MTVLDLVTALVVSGLFAAGFFLLMQRTLMRLLFGFMILGHATNLLLLAAAGPPGEPPILGEVRAGAEPDADPLPQAMALTAIVITFALSIFLLALVHRAWKLHGHDEVRDDAEDRRIADNQQREHTDEEAADREQRPATRSEDPTSRSLSQRADGSPQRTEGPAQRPPEPPDAPEQGEGDAR